MSEREQLPPGTEPQRLPWIVTPWLQPIWYAYLCASWWQVGAAEAARGGTAPAAALVPVGKLAALLCEAAFYASWWRARGRRLPYWRFFAVVASVSLADVFALVLAERAHGNPALAAWLAPLAGPRLLGESAFGSAALRTLFGGLGLLAAVRIALTAHAQSRAVGVRAAVALAWTTLVWLLGRVALWWITDLARGRSPLPLR